MSKLRDSCDTCKTLGTDYERYEGGSRQIVTCHACIARPSVRELETRLVASDKALHDRIYALELYCQTLESNMQRMERQWAAFLLNHSLSSK